MSYFGTYYVSSIVVYQLQFPPEHRRKSWHRDVKWLAQGQADNKLQN